MSSDLQIALYGASAVGFLSILAGVIRQAMWNRNDFRLARSEARSSFLQAQISELYSPLLGLLIESNTYYETLKRITIQLNAEGKQKDTSLAETDQAVSAIELRFNQDYFEPLRVKVIDLLCAKRHLIEEDRFPIYLQEFIVHATEYEAKRTVVSELGAGVNLNGLDGAKWPKEIIPEVENTLYQLRKEYRTHLRLAGRMG